MRAIDFGMFDFLVVPLLRALKWVNGYVGNYGWSIIVLTIIINLVMFPLKHKSIVSMRKMQELQPQMKAIQDRYAKLKMTDPGRQKMNEEVMALYKQNGTNPASGCVPMLLTLPVLVAFYAMLSVAIELRGAPFVGWIKDLSSYDPYFVTPILMGAHHVRAAEDDAVGRRSGAGEDDDVHAADVHRHADVGSERPRVVLDLEQPVGDRSAGADESADRSAAAAQRASAGGAATQERRRGQVTAGEGAEVMDLHGRVREFLERTLGAMGVPLDVAIEESPESVRLDLSGEGGELLLQRRGETLDALQHIVNTAFRRELDGDRSFVVDCLGYRKGKDAELQQMARFSMEKVKATGAPQEIGPLNPYARRLVHITVAADPQLTSESIGDAFLKTVIISVRR